jgi:hypothetical protein
MKRFTRKSGEPRARNEAERKLRAAIERLPADARRALERSMAASLCLPSPCEDPEDEAANPFDSGKL